MEFEYPQINICLHLKKNVRPALNFKIIRLVGVLVELRPLG